MIVNCPVCGPVDAESPEEFEAALIEAMTRPIEGATEALLVEAKAARDRETDGA